MFENSFTRKFFFDRLLYVARRLPPGKFRESLEISLRGLPSGHTVGCRAARLNRLADEMSDCQDYLEIGVQFGFTFSSVTVKNKTGVDPRLMFNPKLAPGVELRSQTSDDFFSSLSPPTRYDLIFIDGLHTFEQTARDFVNALRHLKPRGVIVVDDVLPNSEAKALPDRKESLERQKLETGEVDGEWFGDVWKLTVALRSGFSDLLEVSTIGSGVCGQAVVWWKNQPSAEDISLDTILQTKLPTYADYFRPDHKHEHHFECEDLLLESLRIRQQVPL